MAAADFKLKYPSTSTVDVTISLASLATNAQNVFTAGQESTAVDNTTNLDLDHLLSGRIRTGTTPTAGRTIAVYVFAPVSIASGTPTWPDVLDGTNSAETFTSANVMNGIVRLAWSATVDATSDRDYSFAGVSVASLFGGVLPPFWGVYVAHDTAVALNSTAGNHAISYFRVQTQSV
jgi:hypothetical protein